MKLKLHEALIGDISHATARHAQLRARFSAFQEHANALAKGTIAEIRGVRVIQEGEDFFELGVSGAKIRFSLHRSPRERAKAIIRIEDVSEEPRQLFDVTFEGKEGETDIEARDPANDPPRISADRPDDSIDIVLTAINAALDPAQHPAR